MKCGLLFLTVLLSVNVQASVSDYTFTNCNKEEIYVSLREHFSIPIKDFIPGQRMADLLNIETDGVLGFYARKAFEKTFISYIGKLKSDCSSVSVDFTAADLARYTVVDPATGYPATIVSMADYIFSHVNFQYENSN